ncbi:MAG: sigma 54-interacting transcriptional regulator [Polyangiaceae bacterium]
MAGKDASRGREGSTEIRGFDGSVPLCLLVIARGVVHTHVLPESGKVIIGRAENCDVRIEDPSISRRHAALHVGAPVSSGIRSAQRPSTPPPEPRKNGAPKRARRRGPALAIEDLGSANGTFLRGPRAVPPVLRARTSSLEGGDDPPPSVRTSDDEPALELEPGTVAPISIGDFIDLGSTLLVVWPEEKAGREPADTAPGVIIRDEAMRRLHEIIARVAVGNISVVLLGETGVGKEVLAATIHRRSPRARKAFVGLNCAAFSETLLESELFGHEKGAFTGAAQTKVGLLETANGGTVFLDEIGELPLTLQGKLLRVLEERELMRVGALRPRKIDVRFIAATNRDLEADVARGLFRQDLFYRLNGISLVIPPLRQRPAEIPELARLFAAQAAKQNRMGRAPRISSEAMALLETYRWPGNIRELKNLIERAVLLGGGAEITAEHLPMERMAHASGSAPDRATVPPPMRVAAAPSIVDRSEVSSRSLAGGGPLGDGKLRGDVEAFERKRIAEVLDRCGGNQTRAAKMLGISRRTLTNRLGQYDLPRPRKR